MLGIILTGHEHFATGLESSIELIAGKQKEFEAIDFVKGDSAEFFYNEIESAINSFFNNENIDDVIIFTDIPGGTPFNQSVLLSKKYNHIKVISGTNLPALMDGLFSREMDSDSFAKKVLESGKEGLITYAENPSKENDEIEKIDGI